MRARDVMASNLAYAVSLMEAIGAPYAFVRIASRYRYRIAVPRSMKDTILDALANSKDPSLHIHEPVDYLLGRDLWTAAPAVGKRPPPGWRKEENIRVYRTHTDPRHLLILDDVYSCEIEFWDEKDGAFVAFDDNLTAMRATKDEFGSATIDVEGVRVRTIPADTPAPLVTDTLFPIDLVYTWVDGSDPEWLRRKKEVTAKLRGDAAAVDSDIAARYENRDELKYSLRSVAQYADFVRHIYLVTAGQIPAWLDPTAPGLTVVDHHEILDSGAGELPTFNSHAIEARLHRIDGLAEHYVYMNDDFLFGRLVEPSLFFHPNGLAKFFGSPAAIAHPHLSVDRAANNARRLLEEKFGRWVTNKMKHAPYPQRRSVIEDMEKDFPEAFAQTAANQLRASSDIPVASAMSHYYGFLTDRAVGAVIVNAYVDIGKATYQDALTDIADTRRFDVICLNDTGATGADAAERDAYLTDWLERYYPVPSPWEKV